MLISYITITLNNIPIIKQELYDINIVSTFDSNNFHKKKIQLFDHFLGSKQVSYFKIQTDTQFLFLPDLSINRLIFQ